MRGRTAQILILHVMIAVVLSGCGVSKKVHETLLLDLELERARFTTVQSEKERLENELAELKVRFADQESILAARTTELEALRRQNLELTNMRENLGAEIEELQALTSQVAESKNKEIDKLKDTYDSLVSELHEEIKKGEIKVTQALDRLSVNMVERILFDSGSAEIKAEGIKVLKRLGEILSKVEEKEIRVEGHTDNVPIGGRLALKFPTNWELSVARATNVVKFLTEHAGVDKSLLSAAGYSMHRPVASNDTVEGRAQNRRIEIVLLPINMDRVLQELR